MTALPVEPEVAAPAAEPQSVLIDGERAVLWTDATGKRCAARDVCPHRRAPLSAGEVVDGRLVCPYHGWAYDGEGRCTTLPAVGPEGRIPAKAQLDLLPVPEVPIPAPPIAAHPEPHGAPDPDWLDGDTEALAHFWHPVARRGELHAAGSDGLEVPLLGQDWRVVPDGGGWAAVAADGRTAFAARAHLDHVWVAIEEPQAPLPEVPEWDELGWNKRPMERAEGRYGVGLLLDNQLDAGHFPFVHRNTFGTPAAEALPPATVERDGLTVRSTMRIPIAATNDPKALAGERPLQQHRTMHYEFQAPLHLRLQLDYEDMGGSTVILFLLTPLGAGRARMDVELLFKHPDGFTPAQLDERVAFEHRVVAEDLGLQALFEDLRLPLDPGQELSTKADRFSVQCRQVMREALSAG